MANGEKIIRNMNKKSCKDCIYLKPGFFSSGLEKCEKFGNKNIITNEITYDFAESCRNDENKCGEYANFFEPENEAIKFIKFNIFTTTPYGFVILLTFLTKLLNK
jgi:hypothetical protein